ncbi:hypothetical protein BGZ96_005458 [Linnemannia gamsii]|uniref:C3H1-type domain-containing protein n=1 Tax=Linnemannia gamsii TaxID=64522 RepID=A0ABQ7K6H2_9FUNG|nr:hypothetical protein BGZ96_005458 [Linnemannia gamsii]
MSSNNHTAAQESNKGGAAPVSQDAYDLREMLLQQRSSNGKRQSQDDSGVTPPKSQAKASKNPTKDVNNTMQGSEGRTTLSISTGLRGSPQQNTLSSSAQDFNKDSDTIIFLPRANRVESPSSLQDAPSGNSDSSATCETIPSNAVTQQQQPSITLVTSGTSISAPVLSPTTTRMKSTTGGSSNNNSPTMSTSFKMSVINTSVKLKSSAAGMFSEGLPLSTKFSKISSPSQSSSPISTKTPVGNPTKPPPKPSTPAPASTKAAATQPSGSNTGTPPTPKSIARALTANQTISKGANDSTSQESITWEEQLRQQVQATLKKKATEQSDNTASGGGSSNGKSDIKTAPIILSTTRKAHMEPNNEDQATHPAKRPKTGINSSNVKDAVVGLSLEAIRIERAALDASAALTAYPTTTTTTTTTTASASTTGGSAVAGNAGAGGGGTSDPSPSSHESKAMAPHSRNQSLDFRNGQVNNKDNSDGRAKENNGGNSSTHQDSSRGQDGTDRRTPNRDRDPARESDRSYTRGLPRPHPLGRGGYDSRGDMERERYDRGGYERRDDRGYDGRDDRGIGYDRSEYDSRGYERRGDYGYSRYDDMRSEPLRGSDRKMDRSKDRARERSGDRSGTDRKSERDKTASDRAPPPPSLSDKSKAKESDTERRTEKGPALQKQLRSSENAAAEVDRTGAASSGMDTNNKPGASKMSRAQGEGGAKVATGVDSPKDVDVVSTKVKAELVTTSLSQLPEEPPILFAAANRLQAELNSSPSSQPQQQQQQQQQQGTSIAVDAGFAQDEAPILFAAANRIQQQQQQIQQQQQHEQQHLQQLQQLQQQQQQQLELNQQLEIEAQQQYQAIKDATAKQLDGDAPIIFSSASRFNQELGSPILFSAASRMMNSEASSSSSSAAFSGGLTAQDTTKLPPQMSLGGGGGGPSQFVFSSSAMSTQGAGSGSISATTSSGLCGLNHKDLLPSSTSTYSPTYSPTYTPTSSFNMVMTPQGEIGKSDMSLAFEVMDRCTIDLLLLQQRYATVTSRLTEVTSKALESDARLAQLGAQMELELKMSRVHHQMKNGFEQQQLPDLQRMMSSTQELISRLGHLSTTAAAGSATSVVVRPQLRMVPTVAGGGGVGGGSGGSLGAGSPSVVALALDRLAQTDQHTLSTTSTTTGATAATVGNSHGDVRFSGMANINSSRNNTNSSSDMDIDKGSEIPAGGVSSTRNLGMATGTAAAAIGTTPTATVTEETVVVIRPCLSFNIAPKGCRFRASNHPCPYLHTCLYCGSSSHAVMHCDYTSAEPSHDNYFR